MYQLWGRGGAPFEPREDGDVTSIGGEKVYLMNDTRDVMRELATDPKWSGTKVAVASKCDEPRLDWIMIMVLFPL